MIKNKDDLLLLSKDDNVRCYRCGLQNKESTTPFYLTEWELATGASSDFGITYCQWCIEKDQFDKRCGVFDFRKKKQQDTKVIKSKLILVFLLKDNIKHNIPFNLSVDLDKEYLHIPNDIVDEQFGDIIKWFTEGDKSTMIYKTCNAVLVLDRDAISGFRITIENYSV